MEGVLYLAQLGVADDAAELQHEQIRQQQVQLRLQQNQAEIERLGKLRRVLATEQVQLGVRNIASTSGTIKAITEENLQAYLGDKNASKLNFLAKQQNLAIEDQQVDIRKRAQYISATSNFLNELKSDAAAAMGGAGGVPFGGARGGGYGAFGGGNLIDYSGGSNMNLNG